MKKPLHLERLFFILWAVMSRFKVRFAQVKNGWAQVLFQVGEEEYERWFSYIYGHSFARLCEVLRALADEEKVETNVVWMAEPEEHEMRFFKADENIKLEMWCFESTGRDIANPPELEFAVSGTYDEVCLPFWRGLRMLQALYSKADFKERWRGEFPTRELALLTERLGKT